MKPYKQFLKETTMNRVLSHFNSARPFIIITGWRGENDKKTNQENNKTIEKMVKAAGYGYFKVDGGWLENGDTPVTEDSIFVVGNENDGGKLRKLGLKIVRTFNQDAFTYKPEGENYVQFIDQDNKPTYGGTKLHDITMKIKPEGFTRLRGRGNRAFSFTNK